MNHVAIYGRSFPGRETRERKRPEAAACLVHSGNDKQNEGLLLNGREDSQIARGHTP